MLSNSNIFPSIAVKDIEEAVPFYRDTLGLDVREENGMLWLHLPGGGEILAYPKADHEPAVFTVMNIQVPDVEQAVIDLRSSGVQMEQYDDPEYGTDENGISDGSAAGMPKVAWFRDPSGNILSVMS